MRSGSATHSSRRVAPIIAPALLSLAFALVLCCCCAPLPKEAFENTDSPEDWYSFAERAVGEPPLSEDPDNDRAVKNPKATLYYMLSQEVRDKYGYFIFEQGWSQFKAQFSIDAETAKLVTWEYLIANPVGPEPAARMRIEYAHPESGRVQEDLLLVLQIAETYGERWPQWRVYYPYGPYQSEALWFQDIDEDGANEGSDDNAEGSGHDANREGSESRLGGNDDGMAKPN